MTELRNSLGSFLDWFKRLLFGSEVSIQNVEVSPKTARVDEDVGVTVTVANEGRVEGKGKLSLFVNEKVKESKTEKVASGEKVKTTFSLTFGEPGEYEVKVGDSSPQTLAVIEVSGLQFGRESWRVFRKLIGSAQEKVDLATGSLSPEGLNMILSELDPDIKLRIINNRTGGGGYSGIEEIIDIQEELKRCKRFHGKLCIVDDETALVGSSNVTTGSLGEPEGKSGNVEANLCTIDGDIVDQASTLFDTVWNEKEKPPSREKDSRFLSSARGMPMRVKSLIEEAEEEITIVVPPLFDTPQGYKSIPHYIRELNPDAKLKIITSRSIPENYVDLVKEIERWNNTEIKLVEDRIHAKIYVIDWETAIISSANLEFTSWVSSLETGVLTEEENHIEEIKEKVEELESHEAEMTIKPERTVPSAETDEEVLEINFLFDTEGKELIPDLEIETDYRYLPPKEFFAFLINLFRRERLFEDWGANLEEDILLEFQDLSYQITTDKLDEYGGFILANSVGTGKSYVACKAMREYLTRYPGKNCLLIAPPRIEGEWRGRGNQEGYLDEFGISDHVEWISMGDLQKNPATENGQNCFNYTEHEEEYSLIVVDEIHHYRNNSNRRNNLTNIIKGNPDANVLFMGATPVNLGPMDLFDIIDLFHFGKNVDKFREAGWESKYSDTRRRLNKVMRSLKKDGKAKLDSSLLEDIEDISNELSLKITWRILQDNFKEDLEALSEGKGEYEEPDVESFSYSYPDRYKTKVFNEIDEFFANLNYEPSKIWNGQGYQESKNLIGWHKWQLYKRLESSLYAFFKSLTDMGKRFRIYNEALQASFDGNDSPLTSIDVKNYEEILNEERLSASLSTFSSFDEDLKRTVLRNVENDCKTIEEMVGRLEDVIGDPTGRPFSGDQKVSELEKLLSKNMEEDKPTIVFSSYADTVNYLYNSLKDEFGEKIDYIHGRTEKSSEKMKNRFQEGDMDIVITTDIMGEGVNLPRADSIVNVDLPYNPAVLVQRAGRALRITEPKKIFLKNFSPDKKIDKELDLIKKLDWRLDQILHVVGLDFAIWAMEEERIEEWHEEELEKHRELLKRWKDEIAEKNPDDLTSAAVPEESRLNMVLRKAIREYNLQRGSVEEIDEFDTPVFTTLEDSGSLCLVAEIGGTPKLVNSLKSSVKSSDNPTATKLSPTDEARINNLLEEEEQELDVEEMTKGKVGRKKKSVIKEIADFSGRLKDSNMREVLDHVRDLIEKDALLPHEFEMVGEAISELSEFPAFIKEIDDEIKEKESWGCLKEISGKEPKEKDLEPLALIKYVEGEE